ncbi:FadR/GntR family transcriptional regulator [Arhodomonas sp. AD133]|uniref:FadR/GntR family transcriptional regulator n=1 Tax=Arhodomonas sp. AD133 TaxID=3415009 RepID=UPI003EB8947D
MAAATEQAGAVSATFGRLKAESRRDEVVRRLMGAISLGMLRDGEQLPSESDLARQFGVATVTLREALSTLRHHGYIETRRGRKGGSFVRAPSEEAAEHHRLARLADVSAFELRDIGDEQRAVTGMAAWLAAERASQTDIERLFAFARAMSEAATTVDRKRADARFHIETAVAAQSVRLTHAEIQLQPVLGELLGLSDRDRTVIDDMVADHFAIAEAVAAREPALARERAEAHVGRVVKLLLNAHLAIVAERDASGTREVWR